MGSLADGPARKCSIPTSSVLEQDPDNQLRDIGPGDLEGYSAKSEDYTHASNKHLSHLTRNEEERTFVFLHKYFAWHKDPLTLQRRSAFWPSTVRRAQEQSPASEWMVLARLERSAFVSL